MTVRRGAIFLAIFLGGCGFLRPQQKSFFSLETVPSEAPRAAAVAMPIGIDSFELPPSIDRREVVVRQTSGQLDVRGRDLWAAPLQSMVLHTVAFDLAGRVPEGMMVLPGQAKPVGAMRSVDVIAQAFEAGPNPVVVLDVRWILREPGGSSAGQSHHERITLPLASLSSAEIASGMSRALGVLADRIAIRL